MQAEKSNSLKMLKYSIKRGIICNIGETPYRHSSTKIVNWFRVTRALGFIQILGLRYVLFENVQFGFQIHLKTDIRFH